MKVNLKVTKYITALSAVILFFCACSKAPAQKDNDKIKVAVSSYSVYSIAKEVLKDTADITMIIPPGAEPHSFEPTPQTMLEINQADFFFYMSGKMDPWANKLSDGKGIAIAFELPNEQNDPHVWMDFDNAAAMATNIAMYVSRRYPDLEPKLLPNVASFHTELKMLDRMFKLKLTNCRNKDLYHVGHMAFGYMAKKYAFTFKPLVGPSMGHEPSAKNMALMIKEIKAKNLKYIFTEEALNSKIAQTISKENNAELLNLYPVEGITKEHFEKQITYKQFMVMNLNNIAKGLECSMD